MRLKMIVQDGGTRVLYLEHFIKNSFHQDIFTLSFRKIRQELKIIFLEIVRSRNIYIDMKRKFDAIFGGLEQVKNEDYMNCLVFRLFKGFPKALEKWKYCPLK